MNNKYISICGYTQEELESSFKEYIESTAEYMAISKEELLSKIKYWYNGYSWDGKTFMYNPFSTLSFFDNKRFEGYWFNTGTPTFLIEQIRKRDSFESFTNPISVVRAALSGFSFEYETLETTGLLFQTGYLTIKEEEETKRGSLYTIDFPNFEVKDAFLTSLIKAYTDKSIQAVYNLNDRIYEAIIGKDAEKLHDNLTELYASIPYDLHITKESYYHSLFVVTCRLAGFEVDGEVHTDKGRIDVVLKKGNTNVIVEIKYSKDNNKVEEKVKEAMNQIRNNRYYEKYTNNNPTLLAIVFSENKDIACRFENI
jgi:Holliday junction resolvase-like predicted endonuclease